MTETKTYTIKDIPKEDWEKFVDKIPRRITINKKFLELIKGESDK